ncbi:MAG: outer membrane beta-barrel protein [Ferruginibacter sp.]
MKKLIVIAVFALVTFSVKAQDEGSNTGFKFGAGVMVGLPASNLDGAGVIFGADLIGHYGFSETLAATLDAGYQNISAKNGGTGLNLIPIRVGLRYYPSMKFYIAAKGGIGLLSASGGGSGNSVTTTAYSAGVGYMLNEKTDLSVSYDGYSKDGSFSIVGLRLGYFFGN